MSISIVLMAIIGGCKKKDETPKTGKVTFSSAVNFGSNDNTFSVTINGQTQTFTENSNSEPSCGTVSNSSAVTFTLPVGTYTFTFTDRCIFNGQVENRTYTGQTSLTITDGGCTVVRF